MGFFQWNLFARLLEFRHLMQYRNPTQIFRQESPSGQCSRPSAYTAHYYDCPGANRTNGAEAAASDIQSAQQLLV
jgi:hypothetical protein